MILEMGYAVGNALESHLLGFAVEIVVVGIDIVVQDVAHKEQS